MSKTLQFTDHSSDAAASFLYHNTAYVNSNWLKVWKHIVWDNNKQENHLITLYYIHNSNNFETKCAKKGNKTFYITLKFSLFINSWYLNTCIFVCFFLTFETLQWKTVCQRREYKTYHQKKEFKWSGTKYMKIMLISTKRRQTADVIHY